MSLNAQFWFYVEARWFHISKSPGKPPRFFPPFSLVQQQKQITQKFNPSRPNKLGRKNAKKVMICCVLSRLVFCSNSFVILIYFFVPVHAKVVKTFRDTEDNTAVRQAGR